MGRQRRNDHGPVINFGFDRLEITKMSKRKEMPILASLFVCYCCYCRLN